MTDEEICVEIVAGIDGHVVGEMLTKGEVWSKKDHIVRIPHEQFNILRKYYEWTRVPTQDAYSNSAGTSSKTEQEVDLPRYRVRNGGPRPFIEITKFQISGYDTMQRVMKKVYMKAIADQINNSTTLLKMLEKK